MTFQMPERFPFFDQFTIEQMRAQYAKNAVGLRALEKRARDKGGKVNGKTAEEWALDATRFEFYAKHYTRS